MSTMAARQVSPPEETRGLLSLQTDSTASRRWRVGPHCAASGGGRRRREAGARPRQRRGRRPGRASAASRRQGCGPWDGTWRQGPTADSRRRRSGPWCLPPHGAAQRGHGVRGARGRGMTRQGRTPAGEESDHILHCARGAGSAGRLGRSGNSHEGTWAFPHLVASAATPTKRAASRQTHPSTTPLSNPAHRRLKRRAPPRSAAAAPPNPAVTPSATAAQCSSRGPGPPARGQCPGGR